jgi:hypothetical protein
VQNIQTHALCDLDVVDQFAIHSKRGGGGCFRKMVKLTRALHVRPKMQRGEERG